MAAKTVPEIREEALRFHAQRKEEKRKSRIIRWTKIGSGITFGLLLIAISAKQILGDD